MRTGTGAAREAVVEFPLASTPVAATEIEMGPASGPAVNAQVKVSCSLAPIVDGMLEGPSVMLADPLSVLVMMGVPSAKLVMGPLSALVTTSVSLKGCPVFTVGGS